MSLFTELYALTTNRHFAMLVSADRGTGLMTVTVMPGSLHNHEAAFRTDLTLTATPEAFEADFAEAIKLYRDKLRPLLDPTNGIGPRNDCSNTPPASAKAHLPQALPAPGDCHEATCSSKTSDDEPDFSWMKNRQPQLF